MELPLRLTQTQLNFFDTFGYLVIPGLLANRIEEISREFESVWASHGRGHNGRAHDGSARSCIVPFIDQSEYLSSLLDDPRIDGIASSLLGSDYNYMGSDGNYYVGDTAWHSDSGWQMPIHCIKMALYLDPITRDTGCLRVIPGSHKPGDAFADALQRDIWQPHENWDKDGRDVPATALESIPGDLVVFNQCLKHASFGGSASRRMFTLNMSQRYPKERIEELKIYIDQFSRFWVDRVYGDAMVNTASPARMTHLEQIMGNDGHLAALSAKARAEMAEPARG